MDYLTSQQDVQNKKMDRQKDLEELNQEETRNYIGGIIFVSITMVIGIVGNSHVLVVYAFRMKHSNPRIFILVLAMVDFITCLVGMPFIIVDLMNPMTFTLVIACKILRFINYFVCLSSAFILLVIAIDRYRKVCKPLGRQISHGLAKVLCVVALTASLAFSWPAPILYGHSTVNTTNPNITGVRCYTEDRFIDTEYQALFNLVLIFTVFTMFLIFVVLYSFVARAIFRHTKFVQSFRISNDTRTKITDSQKSSNSNNEIILKCVTLHTDRNDNSQISIDPDSISSRASTNDRKHLRHHASLHFYQVKKKTFTMFLITVCFFVSYIPHLTLKIVSTGKTDFVSGMDFTGKVLYNTFIWCFYINNIANCFIYGFFDNHFRTEVKYIYNYILGRNK